MEYETVGRRKDGSIFPKVVYVSTIPLADGLGTLAVITDISERKGVEQKLKESEAKFRTFVEQSTDVIFTHDVNGILSFVSPAWERQVGIPPEEVVGRPYSQLIHPDDMEPCLEALSFMVATGQPASTPPFRIRHADGSWLWFQANGTFIALPGEAPQILGIAHNIDSDQRAQEALRQAHG